MKFNEILPSHIDAVWTGKTCEEFTGELKTLKDAEAHHMNTMLNGKVDIFKRVTDSVIRRIADPNSKPSATVETALLLACRIGFDLREYMDARYQGVDELEQIIPDAELEAMFAEMKRTGTAPALPKEKP